MTAHMTPQYMTPAPTVGATALSRGEAVKFSSGVLVACDDGASSVGDRAMGFVMHDAAIGATASIAVAGGGGVAIAAGTISKGDALKTDANGHVVATSTSNNVISAIAEEDAVDGDVFAIRPTFNYKY